MGMEGRGSSVGRVGHERIGEEYLKGLGFSENVTKLVGSHVAAKRYLSSLPTPHPFSNHETATSQQSTRTTTTTSQKLQSRV
jgi:predicted HD phosphohydrolase